MTEHLPLSHIDPNFPMFIEGYQICIQRAFEDFNKMQDFRQSKSFNVFVPLNNSVKCGFIQQYFWAHATEYFKDTPIVKVDTWNDVEGAVLNDKWLIRCNKIDRRGRIGGINTPQKEDFMRQQPIEGLPEDLTYIFSGYDPNEGWKDLKGIYFAKWNSPKKTDWIYKLGDRFEEQTHIKFKEEEQKTKKHFTPRKTENGNDKTGTTD